MAKSDLTEGTLLLFSYQTRTPEIVMEKLVKWIKLPGLPGEIYMGTGKKQCFPRSQKLYKSEDAYLSVKQGAAEEESAFSGYS